MGEARLPQVPPQAGGALRLIGMRIIDGTGAAPVADGEVVVDEGKLVYVGPRRIDRADDGRAPASAPTAEGRTDRHDEVTTVHLRGRTVLPGFMDVHVHLAMDLEENPQSRAAAFPEQQVLRTAERMRATLMAGVTTARDLGGLTPGYRTAVAEGGILGPRLHLAIAVLSPTGGHVDTRRANGTTVDMGPLDDVVNPLIDTDDDVRRTVRVLLRTGADVIKVCTTGGVSSPSDTPFDLGVPERHVRMIVEETARRQHQPVTAHAQGAAGILEAIRGGVSSVEHGYQIDDEGIALMLERGIHLVPTLSSALRVPDPADVPDYLYRKKVVWSAIAQEHIGAAFAAGVAVALGTDSGVCPHGHNLTELGHMVRLGLSPMQAILAGTRNAARLLRLDDSLGTLEAGKLADLVVTDTDPLVDATALGDPAAIGAVVQGGRLVKDQHGWFPARLMIHTPLG